MATRKKKEQIDAIQTLKEWLPKGSRVSTIVTHVSSSGMTRGIKCLAVVDGRVMDISFWVARAIQQPMHAKGGVKMGGCGMDMGFACVYELATWLYSYDPNTGEWTDPKAGYELKHEWV